MPHATTDEVMADASEDDAVRQFLQGEGFDPAGPSLHDRAFDQSGKDIDAVDYEDISDEDDLPEEEEPTRRVDGEDSGTDSVEQTSDDVAALLTQPAPDSYLRHPSPHPHSDDRDDLFGGEEINDLFGEHLLASPELEHHTQSTVPPAVRPGGLALPSKSGLALPGFVSAASRTPQPPFQQSQPQYSPTLSPPAYGEEGYGRASPSSVLDGGDEDDSEEDDVIKAQRQLFRDARRRGAGLDVPDHDGEVDLDKFYTFFPRYEQDNNPRFVEFFPPRPAKYRGKVPLKPPKPVQPTKLSLDLLPDQERSFKTATSANLHGPDAPSKANIVSIGPDVAEDEESDDGLDLSYFDEAEVIGGVSMHDLALICEDWELPSLSRSPTADTIPDEDFMDKDWEAATGPPPSKKRKIDVLDLDLALAPQQPFLSFEEPERAVAKIAKTVSLNLNDPHLLIDEHAAPTGKTLKRTPADIRRDPSLAKQLSKRYNISNDQAYDLLKENHQHKIRSTLGSMAVEHSQPATKLQYPFYRLTLDPKAKRYFHRPSLNLIDGRREYKFSKPKFIKRKERRGKDVKDLYPTAESLAQNDNSHLLLLEYSEEAPTMMSNFGMGSRIINYYRKRNTDDQERPKREIGETQVLLTQDKSPFANFGHVDQGEVVPTLQNGMFRAPVFQHPAKSQDFFIAISTTHQAGSRMFLRNTENLHVVGQQFPFSEVPGEHSRRVTDAAKKRLRALAYRIYAKSLDLTRKDRRHLDNATIMAHLKGHDMPQTRSKMREFMKYDRLPGRDGGVWVPLPGQVIPEAETLRSWIKPEDVCLLDSMQVGVQYLNDLGIVTTGKDVDDEKDAEEGGNIEAQLAPWRTTKNFINATQGKAMLKLHGEGDPTGRGEGFNFVRTSMKGGFQAIGESVEDKLEAKKRRETGGHSYNVAKQQKAYDDYIRMIWERQKHSLANATEVSDEEPDDEPPEPEAESGAAPPSYARGATPRSSYGTPAAFSRRDDESLSQFSRGSAGRAGRTLVIKRAGVDGWGHASTRFEHVTNPQVIKLYHDRRLKKRLEQSMKNDPDLLPTGDRELDALKEAEIRKELDRIQRNASRREAREKAKSKLHHPPAGSPSSTAGGSPAPSDPDGPDGPAATTAASSSQAAAAPGGAGAGAGPTPLKGRGRAKDATARKCANCGQVGHIKTNRKLCPMLNGTLKTEDAAGGHPDSSFGAVPAPLTL